MKIVVLAGGLSPERNVSLSSGVMVAEALRSRGHRVALVDLYFGMEDWAGTPEARPRAGGMAEGGPRRP